MPLIPKLLPLAILCAAGGAAAATRIDRFPVATDAPPVVRALHLAQQAAHMVTEDSATPTGMSIDGDGTEHVHFSRAYAGLPMIGGDFIVHSHRGRLKSVDGTLRANTRPNLHAKLSPSDAVVEAGVAFGQRLRNMPTVSKVVYARDVVPTLAYEVVFQSVRGDGTPTRMHVFIDANSGRQLDAWDSVCTVAAVGAGHTLMVGNVRLTTDSMAGGGYQMVDPTRGNNTTIGYFGNYSTVTDADNTWGNFSTSDYVSVAADVHYGIANVWDFYQKTFGRKGIFNDGKGVPSYVLGPTYAYANAFWDGSSMTYGDGDHVTTRALVSLDVTGHELSHGVNQATAHLVYSGDAGGLNEANSDILGTLSEFYANNPADPGDFLIGEKIFVSNPYGTKALRRMFKQDMDGHSFSCYGSTRFDPRRLLINDPHYTSGVANRFFYLLSQGAVVPSGFGAGTASNLSPASLVCNGNTSLVGIGRAKAGAIWYRALVTYFTSMTSYPAARLATLAAARDLYGATSLEYKAVAAAWSASNVL